MNRFLPLTLCLILASSIIAFTPVQVFAITTSLQYTTPNLSLPSYLIGNASASFLLTDFHFSQYSNTSFTDINASLASVHSSAKIKSENKYIYADIDYEITLNGVSANWGSNSNTYKLKIQALNLKGQIFVNGNSTIVTSSATAPLYAVIGAGLRL